MDLNMKMWGIFVAVNLLNNWIFVLISNKTYDLMNYLQVRKHRLS